MVAKKTGENRNQIQRYIRLTNLIYPLQERTNANQIGLTPAVDLSYLSKGEQKIVEETIISEGLAISGIMSKELKKLSRQGELSMDGVVDFSKISKIMNEEKAKGTLKEVKMKINQFRKLLPDALQEIVLTPKIQEEILQEAMALYREKYQQEYAILEKNKSNSTQHNYYINDSKIDDFENER